MVVLAAFEINCCPVPTTLLLATTLFGAFFAAYCAAPSPAFERTVFGASGYLLANSSAFAMVSLSARVVAF